MQKAFELQSFENMLQSLQIFGRLFNPSHRFDDKNAPFVSAETLHSRGSGTQDGGVDVVEDMTLGFSFDRFGSWLLPM